MLGKVAGFIKRNNLISPGDRIVVGFSGGADSMVLLHILNNLKDKLGFEVSAAAHINHGLRGAHAKEDADFCERICKMWNVPFYLKEADVNSVAQSLSLSVEEAGRKVRYSFFNEVLEKTDSNKLATAHHKNDQAETILYNLIRGTGVRGFGGIKPIRDNCFIRPLLCAAREEIESYILKNNLEYRIDLTNDEVIYTRNRIRHELIPYIRDNFNSGIIDALDRMGQVAREEDEFLTDYCSKQITQYVSVKDNRVGLSLSFLDNPPAIKKRLLRAAVEKLKKGLKDISYKHIEDGIRLAEESQSGSKIVLPENICIFKNFDTIDIYEVSDEKPIDSFDFSIPAPGLVHLDSLNTTIETSVLSGDQIKNINPGGDPLSVFIDKAKVKGQLRVRQRKNGDRFMPFGLTGTKKLKDYFIEKKVPRYERDCIPLVVDDENIVWVVGYSISDLYRIDKNTTEIINIKYKKMEDKL